MTRSTPRIALAVAIAAAAFVSLAAQRTIPAPESVFGWEPCADYKLATY